MAGSPKRARKVKKKSGGRGSSGGSRRRATAAPPASSPAFAELSASDDEDLSPSPRRVVPAAPRSVLSDIEHARVLLTLDDGLDTQLSRTAPSPAPCAVLPNAAVVAAAAGAGEVHLWSISSLLKLSPACDETLQGAPGGDEPDGELMVGQTLFGRRAGRSSTVTLQNSRLHKLQASSAPVVAMDASADGMKLAVGDSSGRVWMWTSDRSQGGTWQMAEVLRQPRDGSPVVTPRGSGVHRTSSSGSRAADASCNAHSSRVCCVCLSPDGTKMLTGSKDALRLWSIEDAAGRCSLVGEETGSRNDVVFCAAWCGDNETVAFSRVHTDAAGSRASTVDTLVVTTVAELSENVALRKAGSPRSLPAGDAAAIGRRLLRGHQDAVLCCTFAPDTWAGPELTGAEDDKDHILLLSGSKDGSVRLWDTASLDCLAVLEGHTDAVTQCRCATEGNSILTASEDGTVRLWDTVSCLCFSRIDIGSGDPVRFAAFIDPLGTAVLTVSGDSEFPRTIRTTRVDRRQRVCAAPAHDGAVRCLAVGPNGQRVATGSQTGGVRIFDIETVSTARPAPIGGIESSCRCITELHNPEATVSASTTTHLSWSPDGEMVIAANFSGEGDRDPIIRFWRDEPSGWELVHQQHAAGRSGASVGPTDLDVSSDGALLSYCGTENDQDFVYVLGLGMLLGDVRGRTDSRRKQQALNVIGPCKTSWFATVQSSAFSPTVHSKQHGFLCFFGGLWSVESGSLLAKVADREGSMHTLNRCCWSPDGLSVAYVLNASAGSSFHVRLWTVPHDELSASKPPSIAPLNFTGGLADDTSTTGFTGSAVVGLSFSPDSNALFCACTSWDKNGRLQVYKTSTERSADWFCIGDVDMGGLDSRPWFAPLDCDWWTQAFVPLPQSSGSFAVGTVQGQLQVFDFSGDSDGLRHPEDVLVQVTRGVGGEASLSMLEMRLSDRPEMVVCHNAHRSGMTLLHSAVEEGSAALTSMLLRVYPGASLAADKSDFGASVLRIAARSERADVAELVVNDIINSVRIVDIADHTMRRSLTHLEADDAIALLHSHPLLFAKLITSLLPVPAPLFVRGSAADAALGGVPKCLPIDLVTASNQLAAPRLWLKRAAELSREEGGDGIERAVGGEAVVLPMRQPWKLLQPTRTTGIPLLLACGLASEDGNGVAGTAQMFGVGSFAELLVRQQWEANSSAYAEAAYRHVKLLVAFVISSLVMVDSIVGDEVGQTLVSHSSSDWEHSLVDLDVPPLLPNGTEAQMASGAASDDASAGIASYVLFFILQPYLLSLWAMDMASVVGRASRGHGDKLLFLSLSLLAANGVFDTLLVVSSAYPTGFVIWWDFAIKASCSLLLVLRSLLFVRGSDTMAVMRATGEAILVAVAPAAAVLAALVLGFALTFHTLFSNLDPVHSSFLSSLTATVLALGDTNSLSSQPFSSSPFALVAVPLLYAFIGITVTMLLTIFGIVVRTVSHGVPGIAAANLAQERAEIIAYELWADDTDGQLLVFARTLKMPYDWVFDAVAKLVVTLSEMLPWVKTVTRRLPMQSPRGRGEYEKPAAAADSTNGSEIGSTRGKPGKPSARGGRARTRSTRGRYPWVHALLGSGSEGGVTLGADGVAIDDLEQRGGGGGGGGGSSQHGLAQRLDTEMRERSALSERLEQIGAQMETLIELVGSNERARRRQSGGSTNRLSPSPAARAHQSFVSPSARRGGGEESQQDREDRRRERRSTSRGSTGSGLRLRRVSPGEGSSSGSPAWYSDDEDLAGSAAEDSSADEDRSGRSSSRRQGRRRQAQ